MFRAPHLVTVKPCAQVGKPPSDPGGAGHMLRCACGLWEWALELRKNPKPHPTKSEPTPMPVLDQEGRLWGIISIDDLFALLAEEMAELAKLISKEQVEETRRKPAD